MCCFVNRVLVCSIGLWIITGLARGQEYTNLEAALAHPLKVENLTYFLKCCASCLIIRKVPSAEAKEELTVALPHCAIKWF